MEIRRRLSSMSTKDIMGLSEFGMIVYLMERGGSEIRQGAGHGFVVRSFFTTLGSCLCVFCGLGAGGSVWLDLLFWAVLVGALTAQSLCATDEFRNARSIALYVSMEKEVI